MLGWLKALKRDLLTVRPAHIHSRLRFNPLYSFCPFSVIVWALDLEFTSCIKWFFITTAYTFPDQKKQETDSGLSQLKRAFCLIFHAFLCKTNGSDRRQGREMSNMKTSSAYHVHLRGSAWHPTRMDMGGGVRQIKWEVEERTEKLVGVVPNRRRITQNSLWI